MAVIAALTLGGVATAASAQGARDMEALAADIAQRYLATWSSSGELSIANVPYVYGPRVRFYGRSLSWAGLVEEKRRAVRRWPVRSYAHRPGSMEVICNEAQRRCAARSIIDYQVANPASGRRAAGAATFDLGISFAGPQPVILYENGRPIRRGGAA